jgi:glutathione synthase/RimK-type ligase-like ATP-grasp enzyme
MTRTVLVLTQPDDYHVQLTSAALRRRGARVVEFHTADFPTLDRLRVQLDQGRPHGDLVLGRNGERLDLADVTSAWFRRPERAQLPDWPPAVHKFAAREVDHALTGLWTALDWFWVSRPDRIAVASYKLPQLGWASAVGLRVPATIVTSDPDQARQFYEEHAGQIVYKTLYLGSVNYTPTSIGVIYTTPITPGHFRALQRVSVVPCLFQEYVPKRLELRVTVIGDAVLTVAIDSQATERTRHDWRRYDPHTPYFAYPLPEHISAACRTLVRRLGLEFGAIDLIVRPDGEYVFLEINPNGQWAWLEPLSGLPFTDTLADLLMAGKRGVDRTTTAPGIPEGVA